MFLLCTCTMLGTALYTPPPFVTPKHDHLLFIRESMVSAKMLLSDKKSEKFYVETCRINKVVVSLYITRLKRTIFLYSLTIINNWRNSWEWKRRMNLYTDGIARKESTGEHVLDHEITWRSVPQLSQLCDNSGRMVGKSVHGMRGGWGMMHYGSS